MTSKNDEAVSAPTLTASENTTNTRSLTAASTPRNASAALRIIKRRDGEDVAVYLDSPAIVIVTGVHEIRLLGHEAIDLQVALTLAVARVGGKRGGR